MPTSYSQASQIIESTLEANWSFTPIAWENVDALDYSSVDRKRLSEGEDPYIKVEILYNSAPAAEVGKDPIKRAWGSLAVDFLTKQGKGSDINHVNMGNLANIFEYQTISDIVFREIEIFRPLTAQGWYITPTMVRFYFNR